MEEKELSVKLLVDKERNRVVWAECNDDCIDILLSFLTLPIGTVVRLCRDIQSPKIGGMQCLYESVEVLDLKYFQTPECKNMLLHPKSCSHHWCEGLVVNIDDTEPTKYYVGPRGVCCGSENHCISTVNNSLCWCGNKLIHCLSRKPKNTTDHGVFIDGIMNFMITDDLKLMPTSVESIVSVFKGLGIASSNTLEEKTVNFGAQEVKHLLMRMLVSKTPLTDVFLGQLLDSRNNPYPTNESGALDSNMRIQSNTTEDQNSNANSISIKLVIDRHHDRVVAAEAGEEFSDLLFNFLAFPLGSIAKCLGGDSNIACLDNLYKSIEDLNSQNLFKSGKCPLLCDPKLPPFFKSSNQLVQVDELPWQPSGTHCDPLHLEKLLPGETPTESNYCKHGYLWRPLHPINPKYPSLEKRRDGAFVSGPAKFMVSDNLVVKPHSAISSVFSFSNLNIVRDIEVHTVSIGEAEALLLLKASLSSSSVLNDVFPRNTQEEFKSRKRHLLL